MNTASRIGTSLASYAGALLRNALITTLLFMAGFAVAGVPWWFLTGLVCGLLNLIPSLGPILSLGLGLYVQFLGSEDWTALAWVGGIWLVIQILDGFVLSPRAAGKAGVNPWLSILLVLAGGMLFGPLGMLLAVPVAAVMLIVFRAVRAH
jgi:predicted PurR-regulated permease PerM